MSQDFPKKTITNVVFSSAGGGTDVMNRQLAAVMEKTMGQKMIVTNMPGGLGGTAAEHVWAQPHDGYTVLGVSETLLHVHGQQRHQAQCQGLGFLYWCRFAGRDGGPDGFEIAPSRLVGDIWD